MYHCPYPEEHHLGGKKIPEGGTVRKITGILFVMNPEGQYHTVLITSIPTSCSGAGWELAIGCNMTAIGRNLTAYCKCVSKVVALIG